jgi:poly(beta-D-mannuronate) lyase
MSSGTTTQPETYDFADVAARYVRILGHGNSQNTWNSITEVDIWGH